MGARMIGKRQCDLCGGHLTLTEEPRDPSDAEREAVQHHDTVARAECSACAASFLACCETDEGVWPTGVIVDTCYLTSLGSEPAIADLPLYRTILPPTVLRGARIVDPTLMERWQLFADADPDGQAVWAVRSEAARVADES